MDQHEHWPECTVLYSRARQQMQKNLNQINIQLFNQLLFA